MVLSSLMGYQPPAILGAQVFPSSMRCHQAQMCASKYVPMAGFIPVPSAWAPHLQPVEEQPLDLNLLAENKTGNVQLVRYFYPLNNALNLQEHNSVPRLESKYRERHESKYKRRRPQRTPDPNVKTPHKTCACGISACVAPRVFPNSMCRWTSIPRGRTTIKPPSRTMKTSHTKHSTQPGRLLHEMWATRCPAWPRAS